MTALIVALAIAAVPLMLLVAQRLKASGHVVPAEALTVTLHVAEKLGHGESIAQAVEEETMSDEARDLFQQARTLVAARLKLGLVLAFMFVGAGCVVVENNVYHSKGAGRIHQDVGRVTSSDQAASLTADVPVSMLPK